MPAIATPSVKSIILTIDRPYEADGITLRDDLIGVKVWYSTVSGFTPLDAGGNQIVAPAYDGPSLNCVLAGLTAGTQYYVRYALVSEIDPTYISLSDQIACTPSSEVSGKDALAVILTNDSNNVPASSAGVVSSYIGTGTDILVYEGSTALTASLSGAAGTFSIGTPTVSPAASITVGARTYSGAAATVAAHSAMSNSVDVVTITYPVVIKTLAGSTVTINKTQTVTKSKVGATGTSGDSAITSVLSNENFSFPATSAGAVSSYTGSGTAIYVYEGANQLAYDGVGTANGTWKVATAVSNIVIGTLTDSGTYLTVGDHSGVAAGVDTSTITYTITGKSSAGVAFSLTKVQTFSKAKAGSAGAQGAQGPSVVITASGAKPLVFNATDGVLDAGQSFILSASTSGITSPTYVWSFVGLEVNPTASTNSAQSISAANFGNSKSATITCTVSGVYVGQVTIARLEKSTAAAGANNTSIDANGAIQGVSSGAGTGVANTKIALSKNGVLSGAGASEQVNLTYIPGALTADRLITGTLSADTEIVIGDNVTGIKISAVDQSIVVRGAITYKICIFLKGDLTPAAYKPSSFDETSSWNTMSAAGWTDYLSPSQIVNGYFWVAVGTVTRAGMIDWLNIGLNNGNNKCYVDLATATANSAYHALFRNNSSPTVAPATGSFVNTPVAPSAGQYQWIRLGSYSPGGYSYSNIMASNENDKRVSYSPIRIGKINDNSEYGYGIQGKDSIGNQIFRLDDQGLYLKPNLPSSHALGISSFWTTVTEGSEYQLFYGATSASTGITTSYYQLCTLNDVDSSGGAAGMVFRLEVIGEFDRVTNSSGYRTTQYNMFKTAEFVVRPRIISGVTTYSINEAAGSSYTDGGTTLPITKAAIIIDTTGSFTGTPGVLLRLQSVTQYDYSNPTYSDSTIWRFAVWKFEGA